jgi:phosphoglycerate dehydrogenase-like enzyme
VLSVADVVALLASAGPGHRHLIDARALARMKPSA